MTTNQNNHAAQADHFVKAAQAAMFAARESDDPDALYREAKFAINAASIHSRLAVAEAVQRSFPALPFETTEALPGHLAEYGIEMTAGGKAATVEDVEAAMALLRNKRMRG